MKMDAMGIIWAGDKCDGDESGGDRVGMKITWRGWGWGQNVVLVQDSIKNISAVKGQSQPQL